MECASAIADKLIHTNTDTASKPNKGTTTAPTGYIFVCFPDKI